MPYSVRMRSAQGGSHETGGRHISGAERLVTDHRVKQVAEEMLIRATTHSRGEADYINIIVEKVDSADIRSVPLLPVTNVEVSALEEGRKAALQWLVRAGVTEEAARLGMDALLALTDSMRGAMLVCSDTGARCDEQGSRGIRVSRLDIADENQFQQCLEQSGLTGIHVREALVLASKVAAAPGIAAELCWSDDPEYTTGYVASAAGYIRFPYLKPYGSPVGGRVFFVQPDCDVSTLIRYLETTPVLVTVPPGW